MCTKIEFRFLLREAHVCVYMYPFSVHQVICFNGYIFRNLLKVVSQSVCSVRRIAVWIDSLPVVTAFAQVPAYYEYLDNVIRNPV